MTRHVICFLSIAPALSISACQAPEGQEGLSVREVQFAIRNTDQEIHGDLKSLKAGFPQLAGIEKAKVGLSRDAKTARFLYEKGRLSEPKAPAGPRFEKDGCGVFIVATVKP